ncbi:MAG: hypothetical protein KC422_09380 [Trueperaceae bacterium]|nr:hypothetical protein [Trueperaceae bacterium]
MASTLLQQAIQELEKLPLEAQNAIAARWLEELKDERQWELSFASTTDEQWDKLAQSVRKDIASGDITSLAEFLDES